MSSDWLRPHSELISSLLISCSCPFNPEVLQLIVLHFRWGIFCLRCWLMKVRVEPSSMTPLKVPLKFLDRHPMAVSWFHPGQRMTFREAISHLFVLCKIFVRKISWKTAWQCLALLSTGPHPGLARALPRPYSGLIRASPGPHEGLTRASWGPHPGLTRASSGNTG